MGQRILIGTGILGWDGFERRSGRYGSIVLDNEGFEGNGKGTIKAVIEVDPAMQLSDKRARVTVEVVEPRDSAHAGDGFLKLKPTRPDKGETVDLGVGIFSLERAGFALGWAFQLRPGDNRPEQWMDPRKLFRLHDQTVKVYVELTDAPFTESANIASAPDGTISNGDGSFQVRNVEDPNAPFRLPPKIEKLGDGLFMLGWDYKQGERIK